MKSLVHKISNTSNGSFHDYKDTKMPKKLREIDEKSNFRILIKTEIGKEKEENGHGGV